MPRRITEIYRQKSYAQESKNIRSPIQNEKDFEVPRVSKAEVISQALQPKADFTPCLWKAPIRQLLATGKI